MNNNLSHGSYFDPNQYQLTNGYATTTTTTTTTTTPLRQDIVSAISKIRFDLSTSSYCTYHALVSSLNFFFGVGHFEDLGYGSPQSFSELASLSKLESELNTFIECYKEVNDIATLHDLHSSICSFKSIQSFFELRIGPIWRNPKIRDFFAIPPTLSSLPYIPLDLVISKLNLYLQNWRVYNSMHFDKVSFLHTLVPPKSIPFDHLCVEIKNVDRLISLLQDQNSRKRRLESHLQEVTDRRAPPDQLPRHLRSFIDFIDRCLPYINEEPDTFHARCIDDIGTNLGRLCPYFSFLFLFFKEHWSTGLNKMPQSEIKNIKFSNDIHKGFYQKFAKSDFKTLQLGYTTDFHISLRSTRLENNEELPSLILLVWKILRNFDGYEIPFAQFIVEEKKRGQRNDQITQLLLEEYDDGNHGFNTVFKNVKGENKSHGLIARFKERTVKGKERSEERETVRVKDEPDSPNASNSNVHENNNLESNHHEHTTHQSEKRTMRYYDH